MRKLTLLVVAMMVSVAAMNAQTTTGTEENDQEKMAKFFNAKVKMIKEKLVMDDEQTEQFIPIYKEYLAEMHETFKDRPARKEREEVKGTEDATKILTEDLDGKIQVLTVQKKYISKFAEVLNGNQLMKLMRTENDIQRMVRKESKRRGPGAPGQGGPGAPGQGGPGAPGQGGPDGPGQGGPGEPGQGGPGEFPQEAPQPIE